MGALSTEGKLRGRKDPLKPVRIRIHEEAAGSLI